MKSGESNFQGTDSSAISNDTVITFCVVTVIRWMVGTAYEEIFFIKTLTATETLKRKNIIFESNKNQVFLI